MAKKFGQSASLTVFCLLAFNVSAAYASPITVESFWLAGSKQLNTTAVFESGGVSDFASLEFSLSSFDLVFTPAAGSITAISAVLTPESMVIIRFSAANVIDYSASGVEFTPGVLGPNNFSINPSIDRYEMNAGFSGQFNYLLQSSSVAIPEPTTRVLLLIGLLGMAGLRSRERSRR